MIKIAVIDDDKIIGYEFEKFLKSSCDKLQIKSDIDIYYTGERFCDALKSGETYHLIFLDIELYSLNGVYIGKYIREEMRNNQMQIIFVSAKQDYAMQLFQIRPMDFIIKPVSEETIFNCVKKYSTLFSCKDYFQFKTGKLNHQISYDSIIFFESKNRIVKIHTTNDIMECYAKLSDIELNLPDFFKRIHNSFIVNQNYIIQHSINEVVMVDKTILSISRHYKKQFNEYMMHLNCKGGEDFFYE